MMKTIKLKDAVETRLAHNITEIRPGVFKGPAFREGHTVRHEDICIGNNTVDHMWVKPLSTVTSRAWTSVRLPCPKWSMN